MGLILNTIITQAQGKNILPFGNSTNFHVKREYKDLVKQIVRNSDYNSLVDHNRLNIGCRHDSLLISLYVISITSAT